MEKCIFCGATRKSAPSLRFFGIPRDPGLKRIQWLYVLGDRDIAPKDRVCALHFRLGRPNSDPSHEDFVPHLHLNDKGGPEYLEYLESLDDCIKTDMSKRKRPAGRPTILKKKKVQPERTPQYEQDQSVDPTAESTASRSSQLIPLPRSIVEAVPTIHHGQEVVIKRYKIVRKKVK